MAILKGTLPKKEFKKFHKDLKIEDKRRERQNRIFVIDFDGDIKASATDQLREEITSVLSVATVKDKVVLRLESPGGMVHGYGFAASQLQRIKDSGIPLIVCVDKIAASGGYMMAALGDKIISAPFAIIGSIGVIASMPNVHKLLKKNDVAYLEITAGEYKRTLTPLGEVTTAGMKKFKEQIEEVHTLFKNHVSKNRSDIDISKVATGEYWYGQQALDLNLVDELGTSDDFLMKQHSEYKIYEVKYSGKKSLQEKICEGLTLQTESLWTKAFDLIWKQRFQ